MHDIVRIAIIVTSHVQLIEEKYCSICVHVEFQWCNDLHDMASCADKNESRAQATSIRAAEEQKGARDKGKDHSIPRSMEETGRSSRGSLTTATDSRGNVAPTDEGSRSNPQDPVRGQYRSIPQSARRQHRRNRPRQQRPGSREDSSRGDGQKTEPQDTRGKSENMVKLTDKADAAHRRQTTLNEGAPVDGDRQGDAFGEKDGYEAEGNRGRKNRNRHRQRRRRGGGGEGGGERQQQRLMREEDHDRKPELDNYCEEVTPTSFYDRPRYGRGRGGGWGRRQGGRSDRESWRKEPREREEGRPYYHDNRGRRAFDRSKEKSAEKRSQLDGGTSDKPAEYSEQMDVVQIQRDDKEVEEKDTGETADQSKQSASGETVDGVNKPSHRKPRNYDYTKPHGDNREFTRSKYKGHHHHQYQKVGRKDFTPTVQSDELSQQLTAETYECMVCCDSVKERDQIWSCQNCYHIFHLRCIKKWASAPTFVSTEEGERHAQS